MKEEQVVKILQGITYRFMLINYTDYSTLSRKVVEKILKYCDKFDLDEALEEVESHLKEVESD